MMRWIEKLSRMLGGKDKDGKPAKSTKSALVKLVALALVGMALLAASHLFSEKGSSAPSTAEPAFSTKDSKNLSEIKAGNKTGSMTSIEKYESYVNQNLKNILEQIRGVSDVSVMVTFASTEKKIYQNNTKVQDNQTSETDPKGGKRQVTERNEDSEVVMIDQDGNKVPVVIGNEQPTVRGVIVVARGADQSSTKVAIMDAVSTVLDLPSYKVTVLEKND
ncbi:stage III sporulation protein AG [Sporolactobacillus inulinus]|jgi:stage III sporulation protein AG|uniref:Mutants block sporulation after engulfment n=2 Tax=Sporolactobacillus inulinus TaxID=2078 RepID=A0A0U1QSC8_9BACL|nr:stage III sporulation protein AG [Sporolactobacillus inulinus]KLI03642.1 mutants block sporulation after engulfment [Sporolactobacillus inulinus CASD]GEB76492.1 stage III sporulation protein AG [Sporolactobacillus inulinus]